MSFERIRHLSRRYPLVHAILYPLRIPKRAWSQNWINRKDLEARLNGLFAEPPLLRVPEFDGQFRIGAHSHLFLRMLLHGCYEPMLAGVCKRLVDADRDVIDVGANVGFYTVMCAKHTRGKVLAIEPTSNALVLLRENIERNGVKQNVVVFEGVASNAPGELTMHVAEGREEYSSISPIHHPLVGSRPPSRKAVAADTLDRLVDRLGIDPGFIKVDVEGAEHVVFEGAKSVLEKKRPIILSEFSPELLRANGGNPDTLLALFAQHRYRLIDPLFPSMPAGQRPYGDLLCIPEERYEQSRMDSILQEAAAEAGALTVRAPK